MNGKYDFDTLIDRRGTDAVKWDVPEDRLPMWIADMDFQTAPEIREAMAERLAHGVFGYGNVPKRWNEAYRKWWQERHGLTMDENALVFCTGVIPAISSAVRKFTTPNENVLIETPVYNTYEDLESKLSDPQTTLMILCNPQNPVGKIWSREELAKVGELAKKHHVIVISDEIHCDITAPGKGYVPFASVSDACREVSITCIAPTKTFNLAGLQTSEVYAPDPVLRHKIWRALNTDEVADPNSFAVPAAIAAFERGGDWLDAMREYVFENRKYVAETLAAAVPDVFVVPGEATYLLWIDVNALPGDSSAIAAFLREKAGLEVTEGVIYGAAGAHHLRMNVACPRSLCEEGTKRLIEGLRKYRETV